MPNVLQLVDSLALGGLERVAVDLANGLALEDGKPTSSLCSTRTGGPLSEELDQGIPYLALERRYRWDLGAVRRATDWARSLDVEILHAHGSSLLFANLLLLRWPQGTSKRPRLVWHDHFGRYATEQRNKTIYSLLTARADAIMSVNEPLRQWAVDQLGRPDSRCFYVPNSIDMNKYMSPRTATRSASSEIANPPSPARHELVIVCLANLREQKDHRSLLEAFAFIAAESRDSSPKLRLIGSSPEPETAQRLFSMVENLGIVDQVEFLGERSDVPQLLAAADIGVLSSSSEGLPLALLEYGAASLPVVCTSVGQIPQVLGSGPAQAGLIVPPASPRKLADGLLQLLNSRQDRRTFGERLHNRVKSDFGQEATLRTVRDIYRQIAS